jgi:hypothetical protein
LLVIRGIETFSSPQRKRIDLSVFSAVKTSLLCSASLDYVRQIKDFHHPRNVTKSGGRKRTFVL